MAKKKRKQKKQKQQKGGKPSFLGCAPGVKTNNNCCYNRSELEQIANIIGLKTHNLTDEEIYNKIVLKHGADQHKWPGVAGIIARKRKRPKKDSLSRTLMTTNDLDGILKQYEIPYKDFKHLGTVPIDFCNIRHPICSFATKIKHYLTKTKYRRFSMVFNTDRSTNKGKHWICLWIDIRNNKSALLAFFDSEGNPPSKQIFKLTKKIYTKLEELYENGIVKYSPTLPYKVVDKRKAHQTFGTKCGVYVVYFIEKMLEDITPLKKLTGSNRITNADMNRYMYQTLYPM
jgi:hypothetical protein